MNKKELEDHIDKAEDINYAIAFGKEIFITIYKTQEYCPKVKVKNINHRYGMICEILEGPEQGQTEFYWLSEHSIPEIMQQVK